jgi:hypothetical protein
MLNHTSSMVQLGQVLVESAELLFRTTQPGSTAASTSSVELLLHYKLQGDPAAFLPPVGGATKATGQQRLPLPSLLNKVTAPCSAGTAAAQQQQQQGTISAEDVCEVLGRAWRAAVGWLYEAANLGDVEAAAQLAWLWQRGEVLPADTGKADRLMDR